MISSMSIVNPNIWLSSLSQKSMPKIIDDVDEIVKMVNYWGICNAVSITSGNKGVM